MCQLHTRLLVSNNKNNKTNTGPWVGQVLLRLVLCTHTREAVLVDSGTH